MIEFVIPTEELDEDTTAVPATQVVCNGDSIEVQFNVVDPAVYEDEAISLSESLTVREPEDVPEVEQDWLLSFEVSQEPDR